MRSAQRRVNEQYSEGTMKKRVQFVLFLTLGLGTIDGSAVAQDSVRINGSDNPRVTYGNFDPSQSLLRLADWDDHHHCDGDRDRDDRNCYYRDRDRDRDRYYSRGYVDGYVVPSDRWSSGRYDRKGNFYPAGGGGYYD